MEQHLEQFIGEPQLLPECLRQSPQQCREIQINAKVPLDWALPLYGFLMPLVVAITLLTNSFIVVVLSQRQLRTPTNVVLGGMAISELLTGLSCLPWLLYYYTFRGFETDEQQGLPPFWCSLFPYLATILPSIFHTSAIWLTVYLAVQRFIYICLPKHVTSQCTIQRSKQVIICICVASVWIYAPELFASYNQSFRVIADARTNRTRNMCLMSRTVLIQMVGNNLYHLLLYGLHTILVHTLPCILLVFFTWKLIAAIRKADKKHSYLVGRTTQQQQQNLRKYTATGGIVSPDDNGSSSQAAVMPILANPTNGNGRCYSEEEAAAAGGPGGHWSCSVSIDPCAINGGGGGNGGEKTPASSRGSISESKRVQGLKQNTRMLLAVILLFLVTEIPAALIFSVHVGTVALKLTFIINHYATLNKLLIFRNVLIVISYPLRFAIYCGMSAQFREVVQQMLTKRRKFFFFSLRFPYGKLHHTKGGGGGNGTGGGISSGGCDGGNSSPVGEKRASFLLQNHQQHKASVVWRSGSGGGAGNGGGPAGPVLCYAGGSRRPTSTTMTILADDREMMLNNGTQNGDNTTMAKWPTEGKEESRGKCADENAASNQTIDEGNNLNDPFNGDDDEEDEFGECRL